jgi:hypothetical protein
VCRIVKVTGTEGAACTGIETGTRLRARARITTRCNNLVLIVFAPVEMDGVFLR